jgi:asparaginyl-tRNA synthetase
MVCRAFDAADHPWLAATTTLAEYVRPDYYEALLRPYVFEPGTDLDLVRGHLSQRDAQSSIVDALELGIGTGRVTDAVLDELAPDNYRAVDLSAQMVAFCEKKYRRDSRVHVSQGDSIQYLLDCTENFDFICSLWSFSHSVHQNLLSRDDGAQRVELALRRMTTRVLRPEGTFFLIHVDVLSEEQSILARQWNRLGAVFAPGEQSPSKQHIDRTLEELEAAGEVTVQTRHLVGDKIRYGSLEEAMEIFLNFHLESFFNDRPDLPDVFCDVESYLSQFVQDDGSVHVAPGCFVYEIARPAGAAQMAAESGKHIDRLVDRGGGPLEMSRTTDTPIASGQTEAERQNPDDRFLRVLSDPWYATLVALQDVITRSTVELFSTAGLRNVHLPMTTHSISSPMGLGSDSLPVRVDLFGVPTYLPDSMQFMLEYGCRFNSAGAYYLMPSFRGEAADCTHLCQFFHSEAEIAGGLEDAIGLVESYLRGMTERALGELEREISEVLGGDITHITAFLDSDSVPRISMDEAIVQLEDADGPFLSKHEAGFQTLTRAGEAELMRLMGGFCWVVEPAHVSVPFYQAYSDSARTKALAADLLIGLGETVGLGERHPSAEDVRFALAQHEVDAAPYEWYIRMHEAFPLRTAGFGVGIERYICWLLRHADIRDCQLLERYNGTVRIP